MEKNKKITVSIANTFSINNLGEQRALTAEGDSLKEAIENLFCAYYYEEEHELQGFNLTGWGFCIEDNEDGSEVFMSIKGHDELETAYHYCFAKGGFTLAEFFEYAFTPTENSKEGYKILLNAA